MEYTEDEQQDQQIQDSYSEYAVADVCGRYILDKEKVLKKLVKYYLKQGKNTDSQEKINEKDQRDHSVL